MRSIPASPKVSRPRMPRQYARLILAAGSDTARAVLWAKVPADWLHLVQAHVTQGEERIRQEVSQREKLRPLVRVESPPVFAEYREPARVLGNPVIAARHLAALRASIQPSRATQ
jgi:hypothetical protein